MEVIKLNSLKQRNEVRNLLIVMFICLTIMTGIAIRQASQVAQLNELNSQLIHEQQKVQESEKKLTELKAQVNSQQESINEYKKHIEKLTIANEELKQNNVNLLERKTQLVSQNKELIDSC